MPKMYRQGDVMIVATPHLGGTIPDAKPVPREGGRVVIAHGEVTGHCHAIAEPKATLHSTDEGRRFLRLVGPSEMVHDEHATAVLEPGTYEHVQQCEYTPGEIRGVAD